MATSLKRVTFVVTPEMSPIMDEAKRMFYNSTQSEMIRTLISAGVKSLKESNPASKVGVEKNEY